MQVCVSHIWNESTVGGRKRDCKNNESMNLSLTPDLRTGLGLGILIQGTIVNGGFKKQFCTNEDSKFPVWESPSKTI